MKPLAHHPFADLFPMIEGEELGRFIADIKANGLKRPILTTKLGKLTVIADGRTRQIACEAAGVEPRFEEWDGAGGLLDTVCSLNLRHRSMTKTDLAIAAESATHLLGKGSAKLHSGDKAEVASKLFGISRRCIFMVRDVRRQSPRIYQQMRSREINLSQAIQRVERARRERESARAAKEAKLAKSAMKIIVGDNIEEMGQMVKGSVDLCFIDPPYNNGWKYDGDITKDDLPEGEYLDQMQRTFNAVVPLLSRKASLFVLIDDNYSDHFGILLRRSGLHRRNTIVWWETFGVHQRGNFSNCARYLHYYTARPNGFVWHPELIESARQRTKDPRANPNGKVPDNIWQIPRVVGSDRDRVPFEDAPPQVPVELPLRCILAAADPGDLVLDCFHGNGTTGLAAMQAGRKYIGIERSAKYARQSEQWMKSQLSVTPDARPGGGREAK